MLCGTAWTLGRSQYRPHYTRAYVHHLLHTYEMFAHALLALHNLAILDAFFAGMRRVTSTIDAGVRRSHSIAAPAPQHTPSTDIDTNVVLSILGAPPERHTPRHLMCRPPPFNIQIARIGCQQGRVVHAHHGAQKLSNTDSAECLGVSLSSHLSSFQHRAHRS
jgi:hypothetical protein